MPFENATLSTKYKEIFDQLQQALKNGKGEITEDIKEKAKNFYDELQNQAINTFDELMRVIGVEVQKSYKESENDIKQKTQEAIKQTYKVMGFKGNTGR